jgi:hypothetical protein
MTSKATIALAFAMAAIEQAVPASACTDWKAVAAFDAIIAADDRENFQNSEALVSKCGNSTSKECDTIAKMDYGAQQIMANHMADISNDRESALKDQCK